MLTMCGKLVAKLLPLIVDYFELPRHPGEYALESTGDTLAPLRLFY